MTTPALFEVPARARGGPGARDVVIVDAHKTHPKAHRPHPVRAPEEYEPGRRPLGARRRGEKPKAYDHDRRATACGWDLTSTLHFELAVLPDDVPLCRSCWPVSKP